ncbi:MAG: hypothetical protein ABJA79_03365 [Parafilimonas sp.]
MARAKLHEHQMQQGLQLQFFHPAVYSYRRNSIGRNKNVAPIII